MNFESIWQLMWIVGLLALSAFFSFARVAFPVAGRGKNRELAEDGEGRDKRPAKSFHSQMKTEYALKLGNCAVNVAVSAFAVLFGLNYFGVTGAVAAAIVITFCLLAAERIGMGLGEKFHAEPITEEDLRTIVEESHEKGVIESDEKEMIYNVFDFGDSVAKDIMVPRMDMKAVDVGSTYEEFMEIFRKEMYTRYPVYEETPDNVIGIVNIKDLILGGKGSEFQLRDYLREPFYTYEYKKTTDLMVELRKTQNSIAIVLDEYGATAGLVTLEDMLEEIVGEIRDEYDADEEDLIRQTGPLEYVVEASVRLDDLNDRLGLTLKSEDYDSIGGFMIEALDHFPEKGEEVVCNGMRFVVEQAERSRIDKIRISLPEGMEYAKEEG